MWVERVVGDKRGNEWRSVSEVEEERKRQGKEGKRVEEGFGG